MRDFLAMIAKNGRLEGRTTFIISDLRKGDG